MTVLNPPIKLGDAEVLSFNADTFQLSAVFHCYATDATDATPKAGLQEAMRLSVRAIVSYMEKEGFIPAKKVWSINAGLVVHPNRNK